MKERDFNILIIQAVKYDADFLIKKHPSLRIIKWSDLRRAPLYKEEWDVLEKKINSFCAIFAAVNWNLAHSQPLFKRAVKISFEKTVVPNFVVIRNEIDNAAKEIELDGYEHRNVRDHLKLVLDPFIESGKNINCRIGFTIQDFFSKEDIILNVKKEDIESDYVLGTIVTDIFRDLQRYYEKHPVHPPKLRTLIIVDESRRIFPNADYSGKYGHDPQSMMTEFVTSRRSSGIGLIVITQEPESAPAWLTSNSAFVLGFPIGGDARKHVQQLLNLTDEQAKYIDELPEQGTGIFRDRRFDRRYLLNVPGDLEIAPITEQETDEFMLPYIQKLHKGLKEKEEAIKEIQLKLQLQAPKQKDYTEKGLEKIRAVIYPETLHILEFLQNAPFTYKTELLKMTGISRNKFYTSMHWLEENKLIITVSCLTSKTKRAEFFPLTEKCHDLLNTPQSKRKPSPTRFKHTYYCIKVDEWLKARGFNAIREYGPKETPDFSIKTKSEKVIKIPQRIDIFAIVDGEKTAYEVTISFSNLALNLYKCFVKMKMGRVNIVCENQPGIEQAKKKISEINLPDDLEKRIKCVSISDFL